MIIFLISTKVAIIVYFLCSLIETALLSLKNVKIESDKQKSLKYAIIPQMNLTMNELEPFTN